MKIKQPFYEQLTPNFYYEYNASEKGSTDMIKTAIRFQNNLVVVFDRRGEQISKYQGQYEEVKENIFKDAPTDTVFAHGFGDSGKLQKVSRENW